MAVLLCCLPSNDSEANVKLFACGTYCLWSCCNSTHLLPVAVAGPLRQHSPFLAPHAGASPHSGAGPASGRGVPASEEVHWAAHGLCVWGGAQGATGGPCLTIIICETKTKTVVGT